ncbi:E3 ubiquitin-protein ligase NEURL3 [Genypterus blacodes]|uniref:E3 ubiquitin-protein ligase NEURL3 n=1 Tax=Genypterus blacodes TaxID=154954 RepID=UPI003F76B452
MVKDRSNSDSESAHTCGLFCLGPLSFHNEAVGEMVQLSRGGQLASRTGHTFRKGLVFSSRPLKVHERLRLRVEKHVSRWHGALRVGFTTVPPTPRALPLPNMAIPDLTNTPGYWAAPVNESICREGSELEFWASAGGCLYVKCDNYSQQKLLSGMDLSNPLWAMIDIYGQTISISLLGSVKRGLLRNKRSCPAPQQLSSTHDDNYYNLIHVPNGPPESGSFDEDAECHSLLTTKFPKDSDILAQCVVCMTKEANITLLCGHQCLCSHCATRVIQEFGSCPLCRQMI